MKRTHTLITTTVALVGLGSVYGEWIPVANIDTYEAGWGQTELAGDGWTFQDGDYAGFLECTNGTWDCNAVRQVTASPFDFPAGTNDQSLAIRAGNSASAGVANAKNNTAIPLPQEIPVDGKATVFIRFALEDVPGDRYITMSNVDYPNVDGGTIRSYPDARVIFEFKENYRMQVYQGGYKPALVDSNDPDANLMEDSTWYEMWIQVDNQSTSSGDTLGGRYDLYIRGGKFGDEPLHLVNTDPDYASFGFTGWTFRDIVNVPIQTFNIMTQYGNPNTSTRGFGAMWVNQIAMFPGELTLTIPDGDVDVGCGSDWHGYAVTDCWADTGAWMGWLYIENDPWIYSEDIGWFYEGSVEADGGWIYAIK